MKRIGKLILKLLGGILAVALIFVAIGWWRLSEGPVKLGFLRGIVEDVVGNSMDNANLSIDDAVIVRDEENDAIRFRLQGLNITDDKGNFVARAPSAEIGVNLSQLMTGSVKLTSLTLIGPRFSLHRTKDGALKLGFEGVKTTQAGPSEKENEVKPTAEQIIQSTEVGDNQQVLAAIISSLTNADEEGGATSKLKTLSIRNAVISLYDEALNAVFHIPKAAMEFRRGNKGLVLLANGLVAGGEVPGRMKLEVIFNEKTGLVDVLAIISDLVPTELSSNMKRINDVARVEMPLNGRAYLRFNKIGKLLNAKADLNGGAGYVKFPAIMVEPLLVDEGQFHIVYDAQENHIRIEDSVVFVGGVEARLAGLMRPTKDDDGRWLGLTYRLAANSRKVEGGEDTDFIVENITLNGSTDLEKRLVKLDQFSLAAGKAKIDIAGVIRDNEAGTAIKLNGKVENAPVKLIRTLWPPAALQGARDWVVSNLKKGVVKEGAIKIDLTPEAIKEAEKGRPIPQEQINIAFSYGGLVTTYFGELPEIYDASGFGLLTGNSYKLNMTSGRAKVPSGKMLKLSDGYFEISELNKHGPDSILKIRLAGDAQAMLEAIDQKPLGYAKRTGLDPKSLGGAGTAAISLAMPLLKDLPIERVKMNTKVALKNVKLKKAIGNIDLTGGSLNLGVTMNGLKVEGDVFMNKAPAAIVWTENFDLSKKHTSRFKLSSTLNEKSRKLLGIDVSSFLTGPTPIVITGYGRGRDIAKATASVNLDRARLFYEPLGWGRRPVKGTRAQFELGFPEKGQVAIGKLAVKGKDLSISGDMKMRENGNILTVNMPKVHLGKVTKLALKGARDKKGVLQLKVNARAVDGRAIIDQLDAPTHPRTISRGERNLVRINAAVRNAPTYNNHLLRNVKADITLVSGRLSNLLLTGDFEDRSKLKIRVTSSNKRRRMVMEGQNAGLILSAANLYGKVRGGTIIFKTWLSEPGRSSTGTLRMKDFIVSDQELNKIAHNSPKAEFRPKKGELFFEKMKVPFKRTRNRIKIYDAVLNGRSMGATANGSIDTQKDYINVKGSIIPAYGLNSFISHVPILGQIITGGKGEGVFGINFSIRGAMKNPTFKTDPLSALAPGILRKLLQGGSGNKSFENDESVFKAN